MLQRAQNNQLELNAFTAAAVVELYSEWCGPCKSVLPTFKRIRLDKDDENALLFLTVRLSMQPCMPEKAKGSMVQRLSMGGHATQVRAESCEFLEAAKDYKGRSEPMFLLYRVSQGPVSITPTGSSSLET